MLSRPYGKAAKQYYCWMGIFLASLAILLVEACEAKGILNMNDRLVCNGTVQLAPDAVKADTATMAGGDLMRLWQKMIKG